jgi:putative oxidoreductase
MSIPATDFDAAGAVSMNVASVAKRASARGSANGPLAQRLSLDRLATLYARVALAGAFLSGIASRFGLWGKDVGYGNFANFMRYTAEVNSFMPAVTIPFLAWASTVAELVLGVALLLGIVRRWVALGSAVLLAMFGVAMAISFGIKSPLDYSVFSASAAALLLGLRSAPLAP